jgi:hypothetical protein
MEFDYYERLRRIGRDQLRAQQANDDQVRAERQRIDERLKSLTEVEYQALHEKAKRDFCAQFPLALGMNANFLESAVRHRMARILQGNELPET